MPSETPESDIAPPQLHVLSYVGNWNSASRGCRLAALVALIYGILCVVVIVPFTLMFGARVYLIAKQLSSPPMPFMVPMMVGPGGALVPAFPVPPPPPPPPPIPWYTPGILAKSVHLSILHFQPWIFWMLFPLMGSALTFLHAGMRRGGRRPLTAGGMIYVTAVIFAALTTAGICLVSLSTAGLAYPGHGNLVALWGLLAFPFGVLLTLFFKDLCVLCFWNARHVGLEKPKREFITGRVAPAAN